MILDHVHPADNSRTAAVVGSRKCFDGLIGLLLEGVDVGELVRLQKAIPSHGNRAMELALLDLCCKTDHQGQAWCCFGSDILVHP